MTVVSNTSEALDSPYTNALEHMLAETRAHALDSSVKEIDRLAIAHDASHYLLVPAGIVRPDSAEAVADIFRAASAFNLPLTFRSGGTSLSGQASGDGLMVDTRRNFKKIEVLDGGKRVRVQPGATVMAVNNMLAPYGYKLGPDPASWSACTIGGVVANNSSGMSSGTEFNTYNTLESMVFVLPSGTVIDTSAPDADARLRALEPEIHEGLLRLRKRVVENPESVARIRQQYSMKNTMGYGINSFLDFDTPAKILEHLMIGSEGTLGFVAEAVFNTVPVPKRTATGLLMFDSLDAATEALPKLVYSGADVVELIDAASIRAMGPDASSVLPKGFNVDQHASLLVEYQAMDDEGIAEHIATGEATFEQLDGLATPPEMTNEASRRAQMWVMRNGLYTKIMRSRPKGTMALLEDIAVPMEQLGGVCTELQVLFDKHNYDGAVIFGHAKNGNIHFLVTEDFAGPESLNRYDQFTEDMVELVLREQGTLKAEHGTGRIMSPFVHRQYGDDLYQAMVDVKNACDPKRILNPGTIITDDPQLHLKHIKPTDPVRQIIDDCVECGYCEPVCPSQHLTTTPRQRIVIQRAIAACEATGAYDLAERLKEQEVYDVVQTCAVDGMCLTACPVKINTGDLIRAKRRETQNETLDKGWKVAAEHWDMVLRGASLGMTTTHALPTTPLRGALGLARKALSEDIVPTLTSELPGGGKVRKPQTVPNPDAIFMPACVGTMFGTEHACGTGVGGAVRELAAYAGLRLSTPAGVQELCCGTPWKSKGLAKGYEVMKDKLTSWIVQHTHHGRIPLVCDNVSCTEGIIVALKNARVEGITVMDATEWVATYVAPVLPPLAKARKAAVHPTCSSTHLGVNDALMMLAGLVADEAIIPDGWRCCAFAGDRGLLHEELTATATHDEARSVKHLDADLFLSCNRTCELGMTRTTGHTYVHVLEELAARVADRAGTR